MPNVIPPSPSAQVFHRYGDYPVSHYTGIPNIAIPLYEIKSGDLTLPISIRYHAAGFRPSDKDGILGLNWSLNAGGMISRQIKGIPDDYGPDGYLVTTKRYNTNDLLGMTKLAVFDFLQSVEEGGQDTEYDYFSYSAGQSSGNFVLEGTTSGGNTTATAMLINQKKLDEIKCYLNPGKVIEAFDIINENGERYRYGKSLFNNAVATERTGSFSQVNQSISSWLLTEIISADRTDTLRFSYNDYVYQTYTTPNYPTSVSTDRLVFDYCTIQRSPHPYEQQTTSNPGYNYYQTRTIDRITYKNGYLKFNYTTGNFLTSIQIYNSSHLIQTINFTISRYDPNSPGMYTYHKLDAVSLNGDQEVYQFNYNNSPLSLGELSEDWWGYYNGTYFPSAMFPSMQMPGYGFIGHSNVNREPNDHMKNLVLNSIIYPTGGSSTFGFELNRYKSNGVEKYAGGLRISFVENNDGAGHITRKRYRYGENEDGAGRVVVEPVYDNLVAIRKNFYWGSSYWDVCGNDGSFYSDWSSSTASIFSNYLPSQTNFSAPVYYKEVAEYQEHPVNNSINAGKTVYKYNDPYFSVSPATSASYDYFGIVTSPLKYPLMPAMETSIIPAEEYGLLLEQIIYKNEGGAYQLVKKETNTYSIQPLGDLSNLRIHRYSRHTRETMAGGTANWEREMMQYPGSLPIPVGGFPEPTPPYVYKSYLIHRKFIVPATKTVTDFDGTKSIINASHYGYNNGLGLPATITRTGSNGEIHSTSYSRPRDLTSITDPELKEAVDSMVKRNIIAPPLVTTEDVSRFDVDMGEYYGGASKTVETNYKIWDAGKHIIKPKESIERKWNSLSPSMSESLRIIFSGYDGDGNLVQVQKMHDEPVVYLWDYNRQLPVAQVHGADVSQIAYTSFEAEGKGSWVFSGNRVQDISCPTGSFAYDMSGGSIQRTFLSTSTEYIISYWLKNGGSISVTGSAGAMISAPTINGWTYHEHKVSNVTSITVSGSGRIDELRLFPANARMSTYTFNPLVGMTSECDANNRIIYYEYDSYNRLRHIRDANRNILKVIDQQFNQDYQQ